MTDLLGDYERKRGRAMRHFYCLRKAVEDFAEIDRKPILGEFNPDTSEYVFDVRVEGINPDWPLILGDSIYNFRASLDYLITALIESTGNTEHSRSEFPIYVESRKVSWQDLDQWWEDDPAGRIKGQLKGTPVGTKAALKKLQPFDGWPNLDPTSHPLFALNVLSNRDKHRRLNVLAQRASVAFVDTSGEPIFPGPRLAYRVPQTDERDTYTLLLRANPKLDVDVYFLPTYNVVVDEPELVRDPIEALVGINKFIDGQVLPTIRGLLP